MSDRKERLIELEKSAVEFTESLEKLVQEIENYKTSEQKFSQANEALVSLASTIKDMIKNVNTVQQEISEVTTGELNNRVSEIKNNLDKIAVDISEAINSISETRKSTSEEIDEMSKKSQAHMITVDSKIELLISNVESLRKKQENLAGIISSKISEIENNFLEINSLLKSYYEKLTVKQRNRNILLILTFISIVALIIIVILK